MSESTHSSSAEEHDDGKLHIHAGDIRVYLAVFGALLFFTAVTVGLSYVHLGAANLAIAIFIASIKATLVATVFMHLKDDRRILSLILVGGVMFIGIFFAYTMNDTEHRQNELNDVNGNKVYLGGDEKQAPGGFEPPERSHGKKAEGEAPAAH